MKRPLTDEEERLLVEAALEARKNASAPYSKFRVGAAVLDVDGRIRKGCNVESASYGLTVCAERNAVFAAIADGARSFVGVAVAVDGDELAYPCGACRQVLWDQCRDIPVVCVTSGGALIRSSMAELLPHGFEFGGPES